MLRGGVLLFIGWMFSRQQSDVCCGVEFEIVADIASAIDVWSTTSFCAYRISDANWECQHKRHLIDLVYLDSDASKNTLYSTEGIEYNTFCRILYVFRINQESLSLHHSKIFQF